MSFTTRVKNELTGLKESQAEKIAFLSAFFRNAAKWNDKEMELITENASTAKKIYLDLKELYGIHAEIVTKKNTVLKKNTLYQLRITERTIFLLETLSMAKEGTYLETPPAFLVGDNEEIRSYLMGVFLATGSVNDPKTSQYHLELLIDQPKEAVFVQKLMNVFDLNAKLLTRDKGYMIYLKESEKISDFLKIIKANHAVLYFEDIRAFHENKNRTNRLNNCEQANTDKIIQTSYIQLEQSRLLEEKLGLEQLDEKIKEACEYRKKYPEASLKELSEIISLETGKNITKSGLNHRFRKIKELASQLEQK